MKSNQLLIEYQPSNYQGMSILLREDCIYEKSNFMENTKNEEEVIEEIGSIF